MKRFEPVLTAFFLANWIVGLLALFRAIEAQWGISIGLYQLFSTAAAIGWLFGNIYVVRSKRVPRVLRKGLLMIYYVGPHGPLLLLRMMAPPAEQATAPLVPLYSFAVFTVFFLVPVVLKKVRPSRSKLHIGRRREK